MSHYEYEYSIEIDKHGYPFFSLLMAAMRKADTNNLEALKFAFPHTWKELKDRYNLPGGRYPHENT